MVNYILYGNVTIFGFAINCMKTSVYMVSNKFPIKRRWCFCEYKNSNYLWYYFLYPLASIPDDCLCHSYGSLLSFHLFHFSQKWLKYHLLILCNVLFVAFHSLFYTYFFQNLKVNLCYVAWNGWSMAMSFSGCKNLDKILKSVLFKITFKRYKFRSVFVLLFLCFLIKI